ncbi:MAG: cyclodeaminase/cyclohydrolase family protein [Candidatus Methylomirabilales bacterium]
MRFRDMTVQGFVDALAGKDPTPGGGSASALAGAMAAGLVAMVARTTAGNKKFADRAAGMEALAREADGLRADLLVLTEEDAAAFDQVMAAVRMPRESAEQQAARSRALQEAYRAAAGPPMKVCDASVRLLGLARRAAEEGTPGAASDAGVGGLLAAAALEGAALNVRINLAALKDEPVRAAFTERLRLLEGQGRDLAAAIQRAVAAALA